MVVPAGTRNSMTDPVRAKNRRATPPDAEGDVVDSATRVEASVTPAHVLDAIPDAVLGVDRQGRIRIANQAAATLFGYPIERLMRGTVERLLPETVRARHGPLVESFFAHPVARPMGGGLPLAARRRNGDVFFADISLASVETASHGRLALIMVRDVSELRRERLIAAQYLMTQALAESPTLAAAASAVLEAVGPASGANIAALWAVDPQGAARFVDSWCSSERLRMFHTQSVEFVFPPGLGHVGGVLVDHDLRWCSDVLADARFHRKGMARRLGVRAGVWLPFSDGHGRVLGVLELLFGVVRDPDPGMLRLLESFAGQIAQYLALRRSEAERQRVLGQIVSSVEDERRRIASELHDDTVQVLIASLLSMDRLQRAIEPSNEHARELLARVRDTLAIATERTRHLIFDLRPQLLEADGVMPAIAEVAAVAGREAGFAVDVAESPGRFDPAVEALLYRVMQEAITNARRHARPTRVRCSLQTVEGGVIGEVADDGVGFEVDDAIERARQRLSFGLSTIVELVRLAGGSVDVRSEPGDGTVVRIWLPLRLRPQPTAAG
jgi:PAS domain S-box-containing protein